MVKPSHDNWLCTNSGKIIDLHHPDPSQIDINDIAGALSKLSRFNGQIKRQYTVAEHSMNVASLVHPKYKLQALLHDASEAYICDIPTPFKRMLGEIYYATERKLQGVIGDALGVDLVNLPPVVKHADEIMLFSEKEHLIQTQVDWGWGDEVIRMPSIGGAYTESSGIVAQFLRRYNEYKRYKE